MKNTANKFGLSGSVKTLLTAAIAIGALSACSSDVEKTADVATDNAETTEIAAAPSMPTDGEAPQASTESTLEVQPPSSYDDVSQDSKYAEVGKIYEEATAPEAQQVGWEELAQTIKAATADEMVTNEEYAQIQAEYLFMKESVARWMLVDSLGIQTQYADDIDPSAALPKMIDKPYQSVFQAYDSVYGMKDDPANVVFKEKVKDALADTSLSQKEYEDIIVGYNEIRAIEDKVELMNSTKRAE